MASSKRKYDKKSGHFGGIRKGGPTVDCQKRPSLRASSFWVSRIKYLLQNQKKKRLKIRPFWGDSKKNGPTVDCRTGSSLCARSFREVREMFKQRLRFVACCLGGSLCQYTRQPSKTPRNRHETATEMRRSPPKKTAKPNLFLT